jgi:hypothetical protein
MLLRRVAAARASLVMRRATGKRTVRKRAGRRLESDWSRRAIMARAGRAAG